MQDYQEVRSRLIGMLEELNERLAKITDDVKHGDSPLAHDFSEQAVETENDEVVDALGNAARGEIEKIKQSITRIDTGTYGYCSICGDPIGQDRLNALPYATYCLHCAEQQEHR